MEEEKKRILELFKKGKIKDILENKHLSSELAILNGGKQIHVIYIADDEQTKEIYTKHFRKNPLEGK